MKRIGMLVVAVFMFVVSFPAYACSGRSRDYTGVPLDKEFVSPSFNPNDLKAKSAAIAALLRQVNLDAKDFCSGSCGGTCLPVELVKNPTGPGDLALVDAGGGKQKYILSTPPNAPPYSPMLLYSNRCECL